MSLCLEFLGSIMETKIVFKIFITFFQRISETDTDHNIVILQLALSKKNIDLYNIGIIRNYFKWNIVYYYEVLTINHGF